jgi:hypothetical protein
MWRKWAWPIRTPGDVGAAGARRLLSDRVSDGPIVRGITEKESIARLPTKGCEVGLTNADGEPVSSGV